ncbi:MAG: DUF484 family protein [Desulfomonilaceae bacterium]
MHGFSTVGLSPSSPSAHGQTRDSVSGSLGGLPMQPMTPSSSETPPAHRRGREDRAACHSSEKDPSGFTADREDSRLIQSFEMIFQLHSRSEEIRTHLENIDRLLLGTRTVASLTEKLTAILESEFDLAAARILFRHDHPVTEVFQRTAPRGAGILPPYVLENESLIPGGPFVLDDPNGRLSAGLFGEAALPLSSAVAANLDVDGDDLGWLCLGSDDPNRYSGGMNMDLIATLADKVALGIQNAWDHENYARASLTGRVEGIYSESFFREYLTKEFNRSWRTRKVFSLMALSWSSSSPDLSAGEVAEVIRAQIRSSDVAAEGDMVCLWILLPETDLDGARVVAERITRRVDDNLSQEIQLNFGMTCFSREVTAMPMLMDLAKTALGEAEKSLENSVVVRI